MGSDDLPQPLHGIRVLELGTLIAGPYAATVLAQFGAEVIKVEPPGDGDPLRKWRKLHNGTSLWWYSQSRNKKSITINLKSPRGQEIIRRLVKSCHIVIENFRPGALEAWGLGWEELSKINPALVMVRISGYGQSGPYKNRPGFAAIAESMGGLRYLTGYPDRPPVRMGVSIGDTLASLYGVIGALMAMHHIKANSGTGQYIDVALYEAVFAVTESLLPEYSVLKHIRERTGASLPGISPSNTYVCRDGGYVVIAGNGDAIFRRLMIAIDRKDLANDPQLVSNDGRARQNERLDQAISDFTAQHDLEHALRILEAADVPCGRIYSAADIASDPHFRAREMIPSFELADGTPIGIPGVVPKLSATPGRTDSLGPALGQHNGDVLGGLGYKSQEISELRQQGVI